MNRVLLSLWLIGAALYTGNALTDPRSQCSTQGADVTLHVLPPPSSNVTMPSSKPAQGFDMIELLVPKAVTVTGAIE